MIKSQQTKDKLKSQLTPCWHSTSEGFPPAVETGSQCLKETDQHVSLTILALPDTSSSSSSSSSLPHGLQLLHCNERGRHLSSYRSGRQVALHRVSVSITLQISTNSSDPFNFWDIKVRCGYIFFSTFWVDLLRATVLHCGLNSETIQMCWGSPVLVWGHLDELISLLMVSYRLSQFSLLKQYHPPGHGRTQRDTA